MSTQVVRAKSFSLDDELAEHLKLAEKHLISAVLLFKEATKPERTEKYVERLVKAQELVTGLFREELIRIRGPIKMKSIGVKRKKG